MIMMGEIVMSCRPGIGFLHTGIEKSAEYRTWTQGATFVTRMNYVLLLDLINYIFIIIQT